MPKAKGRYAVNSLKKAISILKCFTPSELELSIADIRHKAQLPNSTAYRLIVTLSEAGLLYADRKNGKYSIGHTLYAIGSLYLKSTDVIKTAGTVIKTINELSGEAVSVGILDGSNMVVVMREETKGHIRFDTHVGTVVPAYSSAAGKALLSELTEKEIDSLYPEERLRQRTKKTIATKEQLKTELERIRRTGISHSREESFEGIEALASVIRNASHEAVAALSLAVPTFRMNEVISRRLAKLITMASNTISYQLGYRGVPSPIHDIKEIISWWEQKE